MFSLEKTYSFLFTLEHNVLTCLSNFNLLSIMNQNKTCPHDYQEEKHYNEGTVISYV